MTEGPKTNTTVLNLKAGEQVEVRSESEILATLDATGRLDALPFMPEMLQFCGKQFTVSKRADKTCDTINNSGSRRMWNTVHLQELRCDGSEHGGCQARCLLFWKEAWLKRVSQARSESALGETVVTKTGIQPCTREGLISATRVDQGVDPTYACQATDLLKASAPLSWWSPGQYVRDVCSGNVSTWVVARTMLFRMFAKMAGFGKSKTLTRVYDWFQRQRGGTPYPFRLGRVTNGKTPTEILDLKPGELVQVRSHEEILETITQRSRNRGLYFDGEMVPYCGGKYRVLQRVEKIVNERNGKLIKLPAGCIMLEGVTCQAIYSDRRIACPRAIYSYWREIWLRRVE
jgi:hypothetical protein